MSRPHRFLRARLAGWIVALGLGLGPAAADAADDPSGKLGLQVGTLVNVQCPAPDLPHIVAVRSLGDIADWFNPRVFEAAVAAELPDGSEVGQAPTVYFDNTNERQIRDRLAGEYGSLFLVELVPAEQRVDASLSGHCLSGTIEEIELEVVSAHPSVAAPSDSSSAALGARIPHGESGDLPQRMRSANHPPLPGEGRTRGTTSGALRHGPPAEARQSSSSSQNSAAFGVQIALTLREECTESSRPHAVAIQPQTSLPKWFAPGDFEAALRGRLPQNSVVGGAANELVNRDDGRAVRAQLAGTHGSLAIVDLAGGGQSMVASVSGHCFTRGRTRTLGKIRVSHTFAEPPPTIRPEAAQRLRLLQETRGSLGSSASSKTLPPLRKSTVTPIRRRVPDCADALRAYEKSRSAVAASAVLGALGGAVITAGATAELQPAIGIGVGFAVFGTTIPSMVIAAPAKQRAKECITNAGYQLGH